MTEYEKLSLRLLTAIATGISQMGMSTGNDLDLERRKGEAFLEWQRQLFSLATEVNQSIIADLRPPRKMAAS